MFILRKLTCLCLLLLLTGCGSSQPELVARITPSDKDFDLHSHINYQIHVPKGFTTKSKGAITVFEFANNGILFTPNLTVQSLKINEKVDLQDLALQMQEQAKQRLFEFSLVDESVQTLASADGNQLFITQMFNGRDSLESPKLELVQALTVEGSDLYVITAAYDFADNFKLAANMLDSLKTFFVN